MLRTLLKILLLTIACFVAGAKLVHGQTAAINPLAIEFGSPDHTHVNFYDVCFYPSATATAPTRCNRVPVTQVTVMPTAGVYRIPRASWEAGLPFNTDLWPKVRTVHGNETLGAEVAPLIAPFSFRLQVVPRPVTNVTLVPSTP